MLSRDDLAELWFVRNMLRGFGANFGAQGDQMNARRFNNAMKRLEVVHTKHAKLLDANITRSAEVRSQAVTRQGTRAEHKRQAEMAKAKGEKMRAHWARKKAQQAAERAAAAQASPQHAPPQIDPDAKEAMNDILDAQLAASRAARARIAKEDAEEKKTA